MVLSCNHISKSFVTGDVLTDCSFHIEDHEKAAIVGLNGAGKSTLLKIITGEMSPDSGDVTVSKGKNIGYLAQNQDISADSTIMDEMLKTKEYLINMEERIRSLEIEMKSKTGEELEALMDTYSKLNHTFELENGYAYKSEITGVLKGLGFTEDDFDKKISSLSGGQKTRVFLSRLLLLKPDIILLDEPTNHLDMTSIAWLETFLTNYPGAVIIVSHDRYFLDKIVTHVIEIENHTIRSYTGNYSAFAEKKEKIRDAELKHYYNQQREIKHQEEVIEKLKSFNREKSIKRAESREKMLEKMEVLNKPVFVDSEMHLKLTPQITSGNDVLTVKELSKSFGENMLFNNLDFEVKRGEKVAIIGDNGTGKTTILKIINNLIDADHGEISLGSKVVIGYYDQEHHVLTMENTLFEEISDAYPDMTGTEIRNVLAAFLFTGDDVFKRIADLSGGERGRVSLAKLMLSKSNFLILDEPTNHLDITSKEILENALNNYDGTVLYVSHDRYFINKTATRILDLKNKKLVNYIGNYDYYLEKCDEMTKIYAPESGSLSSGSSSSAGTAPDAKADWKAQKEEQAKLRKIQNEIKKTESRIDELEQIISECDSELANPEYATNVGKLMEIQKSKEAAEAELETLYEKWEELNS
ncbi:MAG: ABC-F family ATP-binding cassette domain-containing protein [Lachnospiraceae bacterium]|nr:ABC-F family ATP-binding cassette domain-containing protein [Lachnospiraceae bacterium]